MTKQTNVGLLGCGTVGGGVAKILLEDQVLLNQKLGWPIRVTKIAVKAFDEERAFEPPRELLTTNPYDVIGNPDIQVVAELMGGIEPARTFILKAIEAGQQVVTANKALLAEHGEEIFAAASKANVEVMFEAAVAGGIPIIRTLKEGLAGNHIKRLFGILNGTTNYILTRMTKEGLDFGEALAEAQKAGYAEADPTFDIEGIDAAHKLVILSALAYGIMPKMSDIHVEGISKLTAQDIVFARELGYVIKLLAIASISDEDGKLEVRLHPAMLPKGHLLADVSGPMNAVHVHGHAVGDILLYGAGAGMMPTASAVIGDIIELARADRLGCSLRVPALGWRNLFDAQPKPMSEVSSAYYLRFTVADRPGVLATITGIFARHNISIAQVIQRAAEETATGVPLVILTHHAIEQHVQDALKEMETFDALLAKPMLIRLETRL